MSAALDSLAVSITGWGRVLPTVLIPQVVMMLTRSRLMVSLAIRDQAREIFSSPQMSGRLTSGRGLGRGRKVGCHLFPVQQRQVLIPENYSMYGVEILLTRSLTPFILSVYIPSGLLVIFSLVRMDHQAP